MRCALRRIVCSTFFSAVNFAVINFFIANPYELQFSLLCLVVAYLSQSFCFPRSQCPYFCRRSLFFFFFLWAFLWQAVFNSSACLCPILIIKVFDDLYVFLVLFFFAQHMLWPFSLFFFWWRLDLSFFIRYNKITEFLSAFKEFDFKLLTFSPNKNRAMQIWFPGSRKNCKNM